MEVQQRHHIRVRVHAYVYGMTTASAHQQTKGHYWILSIPGVIKIRSSTRVEGADADADAGVGAGGGIKSIGAKESRGGVRPSLEY